LFAAAIRPLAALPPPLLPHAPWGALGSGARRRLASDSA